MHTLISRVLCFVVLAALIPLVGCGDKDNTPQGPEMGAVQQYLNENPDAAARINEGDDVEEEGDGAGYADE